jgi:hypothetical protein
VKRFTVLSEGVPVEGALALNAGQKADQKEENKHGASSPSNCN